MDLVSPSKNGFPPFSVFILGLGYGNFQTKWLTPVRNSEPSEWCLEFFDKNSKGSTSISPLLDDVIEFSEEMVPRFIWFFLIIESRILQPWPRPCPSRAGESLLIFEATENSFCESGCSCCAKSFLSKCLTCRLSPGKIWHQPWIFTDTSSCKLYYAFRDSKQMLRLLSYCYFCLVYAVYLNCNSNWNDPALSAVFFFASSREGGRELSLEGTRL